MGVVTYIKYKFENVELGMMNVEWGLSLILTTNLRMLNEERQLSELTWQYNFR